MLIVARHGRTEANASGLLLGRLDPALDEVGRAQAAALAAHLRSQRGGGGGEAVRVVASPLARAQQTAAAIAAELGCPVETDECWIELDYGTLDGTPLSDIDPSVWAAWRRDLDYVPGGGESLRALGHRVADACADIAGAAAAGDVVVVTHVSPVKAAVVWALGVDLAVTWRTYVAPGSMTTIDCRPSGAVLLSFNVVPAPPAL